MDGQTDRQTDGQTELPWLIRAIAYMLSRVKIKKKCITKTPEMYNQDC